MGKSNLKIIFLTILYFLWHICNGALAKDKKCEIITGQMKVFECDQMTMFDVNRHLTKLASREKSAEKPIKVRLMHITFLREKYRAPTLPAPFFNADIQVKYFMLSDTTLFSIERDAFNDWRFMTLESLQLIRIPIMVLGEGAFNGLTNLNFLNLEQMNIISIEPKIFEPLPNLESVLMRYCGEQKIKVDNIFGGISMDKLSRVTIEFCNLKDTITEATFSGLRNIDRLRLSKNEIQLIGPRSFHVPLRTLRLLKLDWNDLKSISSDLFLTTHNPGASIVLYQNPWHCDCNLANFQRFLSRNGYRMQRLICKTPLKYADMPLDYDNNLCNETDESVAMDEPIESKPTTEIEPTKLAKEPEKELNDVGENELVDDSSEEDRILVDCIPTQQLRISKPMGNIVVENRNLIVDSKFFPRHYSLIEFETSLNNIDKHVSNCWIKQKLTREKKVTIKSGLKSDQVNQFCWVKYGSTEPLNCMTFHSFRSDDIVDPWLTFDQKTIMITIVACSAVLAPLVGIATACCLAKVFPRKIGGRKPVEIVPPSLTPREEEAVERIRLAEIPLRRRFSSTRYDRPMVQMSSHAAVFDNFTINESSEDMTPVEMTPGDLPPALPPRNNSPNCLKIEIS